MASEFHIRRAELRDADALSAFGAETFAEKFGALYRPEDLVAFVGDNHQPAYYAAAIKARDHAVWVAQTDSGEIIAYAVARANQLPIEEDEPQAGELYRLYVHKAYQGVGLGGRLMALSLGWLRGQGYAPLYLGVYSENYEAQRLYARAGFEKTGEYEFIVGAHRDREFILRLNEARHG